MLMSCNLSGVLRPPCHVLQGSEEAQGLFVTTGGLDMLLARTLQHLRQQPTPPTAAGSSGSQGGSSDDILVDGGGPSRRELAVQLLLFLQLLEQWVLAEALKAGGRTDMLCLAAMAAATNRLRAAAATG